MLAQLQSGCKTDRVDNEVGMDVGCITVGCNQHFMPGPCLRRKRQSDFVRLLVGDVLFRREGLHILVKPDAIVFVPCRLGSFKLCNGVEPVTVDAGNEADTALFIPGLPFLHAVIHDPLHITGPLPCFFDICDR